MVSERNLRKNLSKSLYYLSMVSEAVVLLNEELLEELKKVKPKLNVRELAGEIERMYKTNKMLIEDWKEDGKSALDGTVYSIVLRLRELYLIYCLVHGKKV